LELEIKEKMTLKLKEVAKLEEFPGEKEKELPRKQLSK